MPLGSVKILKIVVGMAVLLLLRFKFRLSFWLSSIFDFPNGMSKAFCAQHQLFVRSSSLARPPSDANFELQRKNFSRIMLFYANSCNFYLINCPSSGLNIFITIMYNRIFFPYLVRSRSLEKRLLPASCPSVCSSTLTYVSAPLLLVGFPWYLILGYKNLSRKSMFGWVGKNMQHNAWRSTTQCMKIYNTMHEDLLLFFLRC
jgi:hypothetical protein